MPSRNANAVRLPRLANEAIGVILVELQVSMKDLSEKVDRLRTDNTMAITVASQAVKIGILMWLTGVVTVAVVGQLIFLVFHFPR